MKEIKPIHYVYFGGAILLFAYLYKYRKKGVGETEIVDIEPFWDAVFVGGLDTRVGDLNLKRQTALLKDGYGQEKRVKSYRFDHNTNDIINTLKDNPDIDIFLFSKSCEKAFDIAKSGFANLKKLYIIQPYGSSNNTTYIVNQAVKLGVPNKNVFVGTSKSTGLGIVPNATQSGSDHWKSLTFVGKLKK
jgi:hypothetical protein